MDREDSPHTVVTGGARVETQIDHVETYIGRAATVHLHSTTYRRPENDTPGARFKIARRYLDAGAAKKAAEVIAMLHAEGGATPEVAYYWALALLAGKPFDHLVRDELKAFERTVQIAEEHLGDPWSEPLQVIEDLLQCYVADQATEGGARTRFDRVMDRFDRLDAERREEITRHLALLLSGGLQDSLDAKRRRQIDDNRMGVDRQSRVPKFFAADPAAPRLRSTAAPRPAVPAWVSFVAGLALFGSAAGSLLVTTAGTHWRAAGGIVALWVWGLFGAIVYGPDYWYLRSRNRQEKKSFWDAVHRTVAGQPIKHAMADLDEVVRSRVARVAPTDQDEKDRFLRTVSLEQERLAAALHDLYGPESPGPATTDQLDWLIRWHAARIGSRWKSGDLTPWPQRRTMTRRRAVLLAGAVAALAGGLAWIVVVRLSDGVRNDSGWTLGGLLLALALGGRLLAAGAPVFTEHRRAREERREHEDLLEQERAAHDVERNRLADRPSDVEMARWLDYDKDHLRLEAMRRWELTNSDIVAHVVITDPDAGSARAWVPGGPSRYSRYVVRLFLLTNNGVRQLVVHLDFASGAENKEVRKAFRYDAIASVEIEEPSVRRHGRRQVAIRTDGSSVDGIPRPILRQAVRLTLLDGSPIDIKAQYDDDMVVGGDRLDRELRFELETQTSGAISALRTLEAVAGEGREWLRRERERTRRTIMEFKRIVDSKRDDG